jgi:hypothetical protein
VQRDEGPVHLGRSFVGDALEGAGAVELPSFARDEPFARSGPRSDESPIGVVLVLDREAAREAVRDR